MFSLIGVFFSVKEFILFLYCSTVLLFFYLQYYTHVLQMWLTQHIHYTCDSKKTSVHAYQKRKLLDCWDICWYSFLLNLQWHRVSYFSNEMCFNFYYGAFVCYNETQCLHTVFSLRIKEFISWSVIFCTYMIIMHCATGCFCVVEVYIHVITVYQKWCVYTYEELNKSMQYIVCKYFISKYKIFWIQFFCSISGFESIKLEVSCCAFCACKSQCC